LLFEINNNSYFKEFIFSISFSTILLNVGSFEFTDSESINMILELKVLEPFILDFLFICFLANICSSSIISTESKRNSGGMALHLTWPRKTLPSMGWSAVRPGFGSSTRRPRMPIFAASCGTPSAGPIGMSRWPVRSWSPSSRRLSPSWGSIAWVVE